MKFSWKKKPTRSGYEDKVIAFLTANNIKFEYEKEAFKYVKEICPHCNVAIKYGKYTPDFFLAKNIIVEAKGRFTSADRSKHMRVKASNPFVEIRFLFMYDNKISKTSKTRYSDWCIKHGYKYHICKDGKLPKEWMEELK